MIEDLLLNEPGGYRVIAVLIILVAIIGKIAIMKIKQLRTKN